MSQYIYRIQPTRLNMLTDGLIPEEDAIVSQHFDHLKTLMAQGVLILAGRTLNTDDSNFGIVIFNAASDESAQQIVNNDPALSYFPTALPSSNRQTSDG